MISLLDREILWSYLLNCERHEIYFKEMAAKMTPPLVAAFEKLVARRIKREPIAYIIGKKEFWSIAIQVTPDVLIPRPETEQLVEKSLEIIDRKGLRNQEIEILDLCAGSGCIAAALAKELPLAKISASDISDKALKVAARNLNFAQGRITLIQSDLFQNIEKSFDLIVSNPPYIKTDEIKSLEPEIKNYEPVLALDGGALGLDFIVKIRQNYANYLKTGGALILENGPNVDVEPASWKN